MGCEGSGERALIVALQKFATETGQSIHMDHFDAQGGSPVAVVKKCAAEMRGRASKRGKYDAGAFVIVDKDRIDADQSIAEIQRIAHRSRIKIVVQDRRLESVLGKMITGRFDYGPDRAEDELIRAWPNYDKSLDSNSLMSQIGIERIRLSACLSPEWALLLKKSGIV